MTLAVIGIEALIYAADRKMISKIVALDIKEAGFTADLGDEKDFIQRLIVGSVGHMGIVIEVVSDANKAAILDGATQVSVQHFAAAHHRRTDRDTGQNPFLAEEWRVIDARKVLARDGDAKESAPVKKPARKKKQVEED